MPGTAYDRLLEALRDLTEEELGRFKAKLVEVPGPQGSGRIPAKRLERAGDASELAALLLLWYGSPALKWTLDLVAAIASDRQPPRVVEAQGSAILDPSSHWYPSSRWKLRGGDRNLLAESFEQGLIQEDDSADSSFPSQIKLPNMSEKKSQGGKKWTGHPGLLFIRLSCRDLWEERQQEMAAKPSSRAYCIAIGRLVRRTRTTIDSEPSQKCSLCGRNPGKKVPENMQPTVVQNPEVCCGIYSLNITKAGSICCGITDLIFDVNTAVTIKYHFESWSHYMDDKNANLTIAGPLFNICADPVEAVAAVRFPHFLCLADENLSRVRIAHFIEEGMVLETPDRMEDFHAVLCKPRFSILGTILIKLGLKQDLMVHAVALLYQKLEVQTPTLHLYLLPDDSSLKKAVDDCEVKWSSRKLTKPAWTKNPLQLNTFFIVRKPPGVRVCPEELVLRYQAADKEQPFVELYARNMEDELELNLMKKDQDESVWKAYVTREELMLNSVQEARSFISSGQHYIDRHREELIQRTTNVEGVLDMLHGDILTEEEYQKITSKNTPQEKMRELYKLVPSWDKYCKDRLHEALKAKHQYLQEPERRRNHQGALSEANSRCYIL